MTVILVLTGFVGIGLIGFAVGFRAGAHFGYREGFEEGRNFECARWIMRMASPKDRRRILGENNSSPKDTVKNSGGGSP
jgi:hypothetical protein